MGFLDRIPELTPETFDTSILQADSRLKIVFFWGRQCPNCEVAKLHLEDHYEEVLDPQIDWFHVNTYVHSDLGIRFGLHGIPTFLFFKGQKLLGRVTSFPGWEPFLEALLRHR
ncbi:MAG: thioredoxin family protein [Pseudobdellovibrionaceae bacterium]